jgi:glucose/arabinose dehydrogenase
VDLSSETIVWRDRDAYIGRYHYGGSLTFGPDDRLYLTTGDKTKAADSQDIYSNAGGVFRFDRNGKAPDDNLGVTFDGRGAVGVEDTLWAYGLRNGFRATWDMPKGAEPRFLIGEVGGNEQAKAWEDLHLGKAGKNFGWPRCEGPCDNPDYARTCSCEEHDDPLYSYRHDGVNAALIGGPVYRGKIFPGQLYEGAYFFADYPRKELRYLTFDSKGRVDGSYTFDEDAGQVVSLKVGPEGALWYTTRSGTVQRISYNNGKLEPRIRLARAVTQTVGPAPLMVLFNAYAEDPRGKGLTYTWFFGDGTSLKRANVTRTYAKPGRYEAYLVVSDGTVSASTAPIRILVGNTPRPIISVPAAGSTFRAGDTINLLGSAEDRDERLKAENLVWTVDFIHDDHTHPVLDRVTGFTHSFEIESDGHPYAGATGYAITLTATDSDGLFASTTVNIFPEKVNVRFSSVPEGRLVHIDGEPHVLPFVLDTMIGFKHTIEAAEEDCRGKSIAYAFSDWSTGETASMLQLTAPEKDTVVVAIYRALVCQDVAELPVTDGLVLQLEAGAGVELASDGTVKGWASRVGNIVLQAQGRAVGASNPGLALLALGSRSVLTFDGQSQALLAPTSKGLPQGAEERTLVLLTRVAADSEGWSGFIYGSSKCKQSFGLGADDVEGEDRLVFRGWCGRFNAAPSKGQDVAARLRGAGWRVQSVVYDKKGKLEARVDGTTVISTTLALDTAANGDAGVALGRNIDGTGHGKMDVAEVLLFATALNAKKLAQVEEYLAAKYLSDAPALLLPNIIIVSPRQGARVDATGLRLSWALEGDAALADALKIQIDREPASLAVAAAGSLSLAHLMPGEHTVRISLLGKDGQSLTDAAPASVMFVVPGQPLAKDDIVELPPSGEGGDLTTAIHVLSNDERGVIGDDIAPTTVEISQPPLYGLVEADSDGIVRYLPTAAGLLAAPASDAFFYTVADKGGRRSAPAQVTVMYGVHGSKVPTGGGTGDGSGSSGPDANFPLSSQLTVQGGIVARLHPGGLVVDIGNVNMSSPEQQEQQRVRGWLDASPHGLDLAAAGDGRPVLMSPERNDEDPLPGHHPYVRFDGISSALARIGVGALPVGTLPRTIAMLVRYRSGGSGGFSYGAAGCNRLFGLGVRVRDETGSMLMVEGWCNTANFISETPGEGAGWLVQTAVADLGSLVMYANRKRTLAASHFFNTAPDSVRLGVRHNDKGHVAMDVAEIIAWDRALTEAEVMSIVTYFESVYLTSGSLPTPLPGTSRPANLSTPDTTTSSTSSNDIASTMLGTEAPPSGVNDTLSAGLILRLDAREEVASDNDGAVSMWTDLSGTGNNLLLHPRSNVPPRLYYGNASGLPDGGPAVAFDMGKASMWKEQGLRVPQGQTDLTLLALVRYTGPTRTLLGLGGNACGSGLGIGTGPGKLNGVLWIRTMCDGTSIATDQPGTSIGWLVQALVVKGGVYSMSVGGETVASGVATWDIEGFEISLGSDVGSKNYGDALLAEAYLYERALAAEELAMLVERIQARLQPQPSVPMETTAEVTTMTTTTTTAPPSTTTTSTVNSIRVPSGFTADEQPSGTRGVSSGRKLRVFRKKFKSKRGTATALERCAQMCLDAGRDCLAALLEIKKSNLRYQCTGLRRLAGSKRRRHNSVMLLRTSDSLNNGDGSSLPPPRSSFLPTARLDAAGSYYVLLHSSLVAGDSTTQSHARLATAYRPAVQVFVQPWYHTAGGDVLAAATSECAVMCTAVASCDAFMVVAFAEGLSRGACIGLTGPSTAVLASAVPSVTYSKIVPRTCEGGEAGNPGGQEGATRGEEGGTASDAVPVVGYEALPLASSDVLGLELFALGALAAGGAAGAPGGPGLLAVVGARLAVAVMGDAGDASVEVLFDLAWNEDAEAAETAEVMCARGCAATTRCNAFEVMLTRGAEGVRARCRGFAASMKDVGIVFDLAADTVLAQGDLALGFVRRDAL